MDRKLLLAGLTPSEALVQLTGLAACILLSFSTSTHAFDNDYTIRHPNLSTENFLDINSVSYTEDLEEQWQQANNGWRMTGHSLTSNLLYTNTELKLESQLSDYLKAHINFEQAVFYADKPLQDPELELEFFPFKHPFSFSIISTTDYRKSDIDTGWGLSWGNRDTTYIRLEQLTVDDYFNDKNDVDPAINNAFYNEFQKITRLKFSHSWKRKIKIDLDLRDFSPLDFTFDDQTTHFKHSGQQYSTFIKYQPSTRHSYKLTLSGFDINKQLDSGSQSQQQIFEYRTIDLKWQLNHSSDHRFTFGTRQDVLSSQINHSASGTTDYRIDTTQFYTTWHHQQTTQRAFNTGIYLGNVHEPYDPYLIPNDINNQLYEAQLRLSWIFTSSNKKSTLLLHLSVNLDDLNDDPGDGAGMTYQTLF